MCFCACLIIWNHVSLIACCSEILKKKKKKEIGLSFFLKKCSLIWLDDSLQWAGRGFDWFRRILCHLVAFDPQYQMAWQREQWWLNYQPWAESGRNTRLFLLLCHNLWLGLHFSSRNFNFRPEYRSFTAKTSAFK